MQINETSLGVNLTNPERRKMIEYNFAAMQKPNYTERPVCGKQIGIRKYSNQISAHKQVIK